MLRKKICESTCSKTSTHLSPSPFYNGDVIMAGDAAVSVRWTGTGQKLSYPAVSCSRAQGAAPLGLRHISTFHLAVGSGLSSLIS